MTDYSVPEGTEREMGSCRRHYRPRRRLLPGDGSKAHPLFPTFDGIRPPSSKERAIALQSVVRRAAESPQLRRPFSLVERRAASRLA
jgi:hypothetical protein